MHLSGQLSDWSINDLLQIMQVTKKTGSLDIDGERRGRIHFNDGKVTGAELTGANGIYKGSDRAGVADILYVLSTLNEGDFAVGETDGPSGPGWGVEDVLTDVEALESLETEVIDAGLFEASGVRFAQSIDTAITIEPEDWAALMSLMSPFNFGHLESTMGRGGAVRVLHTLHRLGVAETLEGEDESEWLDRLAGDIASDGHDSSWLEQVSTPSDEDVEAAPAVQAVPDSPIDIEESHDGLRGVAAPASTTLTDGVYDEIRRLRSKVSDK